MSLGIDWVAFDCADPSSLARFWAEALDYEIAYEDENEVLLGRKGTAAAKLIFLKVPEEKSGKNRLHLDVRGDDQAAEVARLESLGASRADIGQGEVTWVVMRDPEGNEFCVLRSFTDEQRAENESEGWVFS
jgi:catechol 2,3-dioxygenase-like lactoylglutathione lyase family enzyme